MTRRYDSTRRRTAAEQTRECILRAALKLHWEGVTGYEPLAQEAGCSVPTVRKHFPTKEDLYRGCTRTFAESLAMPDVAALGAIADPELRLERSVAELCRIHEAMMGYAWLSAHLRKDSPTLDGEMRAYEGLTDAIARIVASRNARQSAVVRGLLDFLSYRALRLSGGLSATAAKEELTAVLRCIVLGNHRIGRTTPNEEDQRP